MATRKMFTDSVTPLPAQTGLTPQGLMVHAAAADHKADEMTLLFSLEVPKEAQADLERRVAAGEIVSPKELSSSYTPKREQLDTLAAWLRDQGFEIVKESPDNLGIYARATIDRIQKSLEVDMVRVTKDGLTYNAASNAPSLPEEVGEGVHAIIGLQPFRQAHKHSRKRPPVGGNRATAIARNNGPLAPTAAAARPATVAAGTRTLSAAPSMTPAPAAPTLPGPAPNIQNAPPYFVSEVMRAYNAHNLNVTGRGQKIAILIDTFPDDDDLTQFWSTNQLPISLAQIEKVNVKNVHLPAPEGEETLDVSWSSGIAPGATIRVYASSSLRFVDLDLALDQILADLPTQPDLRQLSISLGLGELFMGGPTGELAAQHQRFVRLAAAGVNVFVSSGDAGSNPDNTGHGATGPLQAEYESSDPFVVGVGGTNLTLAANGSVTSESGWTGSGGGRSIFFGRPVWQRGAGVPVGNDRLVPDVSLAADPNTGAFLVFNGQVLQMGGTSWSAPVWAGFCALMNEARVNAGKAPLSFLNPLIYPLLGTNSFRDIASGSNGAFAASAGYDLVTGIGVPNVSALMASLLAQP